MFWEENEFGPESVWEINADFKPDQNISIIGENNQWCLMNGVRGFPNLGWGHNAPSENLMNDYESNDPRFGATVLEHGEKVDGEEVVASNYKYFNRKAYWPGKANVRSTDVPTGVMVTGAISASSVMPTSY